MRCMLAGFGMYLTFFICLIDSNLIHNVLSMRISGSIPLPVSLNSYNSFLLCSMFFQACFLLYILIKNKEFYFFKWNARENPSSFINHNWTYVQYVVGNLKTKWFPLSPLEWRSSVGLIQFQACNVGAVGALLYSTCQSRSRNLPILLQITTEQSLNKPIILQLQFQIFHLGNPSVLDITTNPGRFFSGEGRVYS